MKKVSNTTIGLEKIEEIEINSKITYNTIININTTKYEFCDPDIMKCLNFILEKENELLPDFASDDIPRGGHTMGTFTDQGYERVILGRNCSDFIIASSNPKDIDKVLVFLSNERSKHLWGKCRAHLATDAIKMELLRHFRLNYFPF